MAEEAIRKIVNGKLYDTSKAKMIVEGSVTPNIAAWMNLDGYYIFDTYRLYQTSKGRFFLNHRDRIKSISDMNIVRKILESDVEKYIEIFGEVEEA